MSKVKILILFGESCAGKDYIQNWVVSNLPNTQKMISCTTREKRSNEQEGVDYFFLTNDQFAEKVLNGQMLEATSYGGEFYGTSIDALDENKVNIGVMDMVGIDILMNDSRFDVLPVYVAAMPRTRVLRAIRRDTSASISKICERFLEDEEKFADIAFDYETLINDPLLMKASVYEEIEKIINDFGQR